METNNNNKKNVCARNYEKSLDSNLLYGYVCWFVYLLEVEFNKAEKFTKIKLNPQLISILFTCFN